MPDRIAVLCDIHGNLPALEAVLADVAALGVERIVLKRTLYDVEAAAARIAGSGMPGADDFVATYVRGQPGDAEALESYHAILRAQQAEPGRW